MSPLRLQLTVQRASRARHIPADATLRAWVRAALQRDAAVTLRYVAEAEARRLNRDFRGRDYATNVLTWVIEAPRAGPVVGDIAICAPVVAKEARAQGKPVQAHHAHLVAHGLLHLQGYDHERSRAAAARMERLERQILARLGFPDPYAPLPASAAPRLC